MFVGGVEPLGCDWKGSKAGSCQVRNPPRRACTGQYAQKGPYDRRRVKCTISMYVY